MIADAGNHSVAKCPSGSPGSDCVEMVTGLSFPHHVLVDTFGDYLVTDTWNHRILLCPSSSGSTSSECTTVDGGTGGVARTQLWYPQAAAIDANGDYALSNNHAYG